ncbi:hypothetical protein PFICI_13958 [Pestalotiopsis fici W106-1]|uniref:Uncharacterized protein n=1 Tax=Pestalotiopsis fici (strain W106-1 / CGMCC3.15140) TaxID=1229662 RepID=W3WLN5_PESFW|nr:uncharacterized protein PFICI_13958 [Pestalotiopsis fici W106-1]ETS74092.1 hypothetical protein PFICI_13958 [Pestalotiopsis fici W106-1]
MDIALRRPSRHELIGIKAQSMPASAPQVSEAANGPENVAGSSGSPTQAQSSDESHNCGPDPPSTDRPRSNSPQIQDDRAQEGESTGQTGNSSSSRKTKRKKSAGIWDSWSPNGIALMSLTITLLLGISAWVYQSRADKSAEEANQLAAEGNRLAAASNRIALWELCKSEEEIQNTATCIELMKSGIPSSEKRGVSHRVPMREIRYPEDFELFTRHHGLLMHLLAQRLQLNRELHAFNDNGRQQGRSEDSPIIDSGGQFNHLTDSISMSENYILALLSFMSLPESGAGDLSLTTHRERENQVLSSHSLELQYGTESECRRVQSEFYLHVPASMATGERQHPSQTDLPPFTNNPIGYLEKLIVRYSSNELAMAMCFLWTFSFWNLSLLTYYYFKALGLYYHISQRWVKFRFEFGLYADQSRKLTGYTYTCHAYHVEIPGTDAQLEV